MNKLITCFITGGAPDDINRTYTTLTHSAPVKEVYILQKEETSSFPAKTIGIPGLEDTRALKIIPDTSGLIIDERMGNRLLLFDFVIV